ncbi:uncharacterized protein STEHIDRAFT_118701 [Stereum hirsutum FP-91666 SS1]|uniref:uncharacterized protein n=1 Tax=Stereum hirsutum (strain FP-91666) TaxID=721885 RepID=UPI000440B348|nr:uncharacterized protein STEHIDRAFT_118701 [Stereum hirsutum FP-91666 SS1]EIM89483.1 hypothetical protein STEHIDRAFT_118701 [Stereum hirsutum FP-91666 SS1]
MSSTTEKFEFVVYAPDYTDAEALSRRLAVRAQHLAKAQTLHDSGVVKLGGAMVAEESLREEDASKRKMEGSVMIYEAGSLAEVMEYIHNDPYWVENVWDKEKLDIRPFIRPKH